MDLPKELFEKLTTVPAGVLQSIEKAIWKGAPTSSQLKQMGGALRRLWPLLAKDRGQRSTADLQPGGLQNEGHYSQNAALADAYCAYYLPANVMKMPLILGEMECRGLMFPPSLRWMDLGCGPGTALIGAWWYFKNFGSRPAQFWGLDHSRSFLNLGARISQFLGAAHQMHWESFEYQPPPVQSNQSIELPKAFRDRLNAIDPNVVSASNSLSEFGSDAVTRAQWISALALWLSERARQTNEVRWLILVEPGSKVASRELLAVREHLRLNAEDHLRILLPCLSHRPCGALDSANDWCHEEASFDAAPWHETLGAEAGLRKEQMLFSYLVCALGPQRDAAVPSDWPREGERIVSQRLKEKGLTKCFACTPSGKKLRRVLDSKVNDENRAFLNVTRGQVFKRVETDEKGSVIRFE